MNRLNERPSPQTVANLKDYQNESYLRNLKQNYAKRKDNIELIRSNNKVLESNNNLATEIRLLNKQMFKNGGCA